MAERKKTKFEGVKTRECVGAGKVKDTAFYITYTRGGSKHEECVGRKLANGMTAEKANDIRMGRLYRQELSNREKKEQELREIELERLEAVRKANERKWTLATLFAEFQTQKKITSRYKSHYTDLCQFNKHLKELHDKLPEEIIALDMERIRNRVVALEKWTTL